jgi:hypothetical protein
LGQRGEASDDIPLLESTVDPLQKYFTRVDELKVSQETALFVLGLMTGNTENASTFLPKFAEWRSYLTKIKFPVQNDRILIDYLLQLNEYPNPSLNVLSLLTSNFDLFRETTFSGLRFHPICLMRTGKSQ